jgi:hypothetical protein
MKKIAAAVALALTATLSVGVPANAKSPNVVDPATVTPALNPDFAPWDCFEAGRGITCQGQFRPVYENEPIGLQCEGQEVYISGSGREFMTRWHDAQGRATKTAVHLDYPADVFSLSPTGEGPSVTIRGHFNRHYDYLVPGDRTSRVMTEVGAIYLVNEPGKGTVLQDVGSVTFAPGEEFETITSQHGVHQVYDDPWVVGRVVCDALLD